MNITKLIKAFSLFLLIFSGFMLLPIIVGLVYKEAVLPFFLPAGIIIFITGILLLVVPSSPKKLNHKDSFVLVSGTWFLICLAGSIPFMLSGAVETFPDAFFESTSGFTTTGSSIFSDVESLPKSLLFWRSLTHWIGGMGIIVFAVAILPFLGISGYKLIQAEAPGPEIERITSRISKTAKIFWLIYGTFTIIETGLLILSGLSFFDALNHTFATLATGGFSTKNGSIASFNNPFAEWIVIAFMVLSGINFTLFYRLVIGDLRRIRDDTEIKSYFIFFISSVIVVAAGLVFYKVFGSVEETFRKGMFQVATLMTSTGFATADYTAWPHITQSVLFISLFIGGCVGSTSGGIKMFHISVILKSTSKHIRQLIHPNGVFTVRFNKRPLADNTFKAAAAFVAAYISLVFISTCVVTLSGTDLITSLTASLAVIGNIGPGFGAVGPAGNFGFFPEYIKIWLSIVMVLGRLEIFTVIVIFSRAFRRWA